ncbi:unnamed protein product, partial [Mycena citricolor]
DIVIHQCSDFSMRIALSGLPPRINGGPPFAERALSLTVMVVAPHTSGQPLRSQNSFRHS